MHRYRTHTCRNILETKIGETVRLAGWIHRRRDHGQLLFIDLRDHYGIVQCVTDVKELSFQQVEKIRLESVVCITGRVFKRSKKTINPGLLTGKIEIRINDLEVLSAAEQVPLQVNSEEDAGEETRLRYRYLDLRRKRMHDNIVLRSNVISSIRRRMNAQGFIEFQTPILTASSPEGARDFLVPSRSHLGKFYALPQAPQQFKQLIMVSGFDRYFQIAPCFRDEDSRADRSPGEFYQLDLEMSFVEQEDIFSAVEPILSGVFKEFSDWSISNTFPRIAYREAMLKYGSDKPDLRIPIEIADVSHIFQASAFARFSKIVQSGGVVRAIPGPECGSRAFCDRINSWAKAQGMIGLGYVIFNAGKASGPIANYLTTDEIRQLQLITGTKDGDAIFFAAGEELETAKISGQARLKLGADLNIIDVKVFKMCWIVDFPMYKVNELTDSIDFLHNPFSMPQGGLKSLENMDPLEILAFQYDLVCNGVELSSGAIRNHRPEIMYKAFEIAGYSQEFVNDKFAGIVNAFKFGAPPHGGIAPGIDRIVMMLAHENNLREVILFPMNQQAEDLIMNAPNKVYTEQLNELHIKIVPPTRLLNDSLIKEKANH
ncbi:aspartyl-tRNA synthetase [Candidatus Endolissoclinum faulkneri L2]|uniref:Aspartate--tRNA(Asp/Asn) ligase n=1 Tax=Candidatus Endolissoclinum faulkneri L2 TaxID=1193729 RepID=K7ZDF2_9PROT|nr:aspartate--tRNA ligase [Candidatus Endolissoclinum faulkneri]AFX99466.1 aspartyl-tRNA synthetase [Candidatus Endolissoclinum faulkneri L2]